MSILEKSIAVVPAYNEQESIGSLLAEMQKEMPGLPVLVVSDGSHDRTSAVAREAGAKVLDLPCNLGVGGAVQAGYKYAFEQGYEYAIRCDGDGQHPPSEIPNLVEGMKRFDVDMVIGSRHLSSEVYKNTLVRSCGIKCLAAFLSMICRRKVTDPTSGLQMLNRPLLYLFSRSYPHDYPEPEALALMRRHGYDYAEVPATFRARMAGESTIRSWGTLYYVIKVFIALIVDRARPIDPRLSKKKVLEAL
jgi:glycosyltransferase involved in cell wall biosynthesis